jgi:hypothetical protein
MALEADIRPAAAAAERISRAALALGALGLVAAAFLIVRLFESWRVTPAAGAHHVTVFGLRLSYPSANADAIVIVALAGLGAVVLCTAVLAAIGELRASRRFERWLATRTVRDGATGDVLLIEDDEPQAFCAGLRHPRVYISTGAVELLDERALAAVLAHELHHARRRDPLRLATGRVFSRAMFFVPGLRAIVRRAESLAELSADERASAAAPGNRAALARAILAFDGSGGVDPERVDHLTEHRGEWRFPAALFLAALAALALITGLAVLGGRLANGSTTLALPVLSQQPCIVVLAAIPTALALVALRFGRSR